MSIRARAGRTKSLRDVVNKESSRWQLIFKKAEQLQHVETIIKRHLPAHMVDHCRLSAFADGHITLLVDSAQHATHLRFLKPQLLSAIRRDLPEAEQLTARVRPLPPPPPPPAGPRELAEHTRSVLKDCAQAVEDPVIREMLDSLSKQ